LTFNVALGNVAPSAAQPSHIHHGRCAQPGGIFQNLQAISNPSTAIATVTMVTPVNAKYSTTLAGQTYVDVHLSFTDMGTIVACGDLN
jgi:hypothetical protein